MDVGNTNRGAVNNMSEPSVAGGGASFFSPINLLRIVLRRWLAVGLCAVLGILASLFVFQRSEPLYHASAQLEMYVSQPRVVSIDESFGENNGAGANSEDVIFNTRFAKFKSPAMEKLASREYLGRYPNQSFSENGEAIDEDTLAYWIRRVSWYKDPNSNIVHVSFDHTDPEFAARLVNVLVDCSGKLMMQENQELIEIAVEWADIQAEEQQDNILEIDRKIANIRQDLKLDLMQQRKEALTQSMSVLAAEKEALASRLKSRRMMHGYITGLKGADADLETLPPGLPREEELNSLINAWRSANGERLRVASRYTEIHPEYRSATDGVERARDELNQFIDRLGQAVSNETVLIQKQIVLADDTLEEKEAQSQELEQKLSEGMQQLLALQGSREAAVNVHESTLRSREAARLAADENMAFTKVIREAEVPRYHEGTSIVQALAGGVVGGAAVGCALVIALAFFAGRIIAVSDLRDMGLRMLGVVPAQKKAYSRGELATMGIQDKFSPMVEVFSGINSMLSSDRFSGETQVVLVNSSMPGEGKTIVACNLAITAMRNGARTLLIDADLRKPQLVNVLALDGTHHSLLDWLVDESSEMSCADLVSRNVIEGLDMITSRPSSEINPGDLLGRGRLKELIEWARNHYDRIIIDSSPLGPVGDAQVLSNYVDCVILVSRIGITRKRALRFALAQLRQIDANILGCIANDVPNSLEGLFGGAEGYGYGHQYKYGHASTDAE